MANDLLQN